MLSFLTKGLLASAIVGMPAAAASAAQTVSILGSFDEQNASLVTGPLIQGTDGNLYGTSQNGGTGAGTAFKATPYGVVTLLHTFCSVGNCTDGQSPLGGLVLGVDGNLYGTTGYGGNGNSGGTMFQLTPSGAFTTLYDFCPSLTAQNTCIDGMLPSQLTRGSDNNFYGTTQAGGTANSGTVFRITPAGAYTTLYSFCNQGGCLDGSNPDQPLVAGADGNLYGTTPDGGTKGASTIFKITPTGIYTSLYSFCSQTACAAGENGTSGSLIQGTDGNLYGVLGNSNGNGSVFRLTTAGVFTTLYTFCAQSSCLDGQFPNAVIQARDGNFYGTALSGGANMQGTLFKITPAGVLTTLYSFCSQSSCRDGGNPVAQLLEAASGVIYGTTSIGGTGIGNQGTLFSATVQATAADSEALAAAADYLGEGKSDFTLWRPTTGYWYSNDGTGRTSSTAWGAPTDLPVIGDFDGDGKTDVAVFRPATGFWYVIQSSNNDVVAKQWGASTDMPVAGDFDGDRKTDVAVFRPSTGYWYITLSGNDEVMATQWGAATDVPVVGDFDGDGKSDIAVFRPSTGYWYILQSSNNEVVAKQWGAATDIPVSGDFDGDGRTDVAVYRPATGYWYILQSSNGKVVAKQWGAPGDIQVAHDYDGDGKTDIAVWRPSTGYWYVIESRTGQTEAVQWGAATDIPVNNVSR